MIRYQLLRLPAASVAPRDDSQWKPCNKMSCSLPWYFLSLEGLRPASSRGMTTSHDLSSSAFMTSSALTRRETDYLDVAHIELAQTNSAATAQRRPGADDRSDVRITAVLEL